MGYKSAFRVRMSDIEDGTLVDVLEAIACFVNEIEPSVGCYPSLETIMRVSRKSKPTVRAAIKALREKGFLSFEQEAGEKRIYYLNLDLLPEAEQKVHPVNNPTDEKGAPGQKVHPVKNFTEEGQKVHPEGGKELSPEGGKNFTPKREEKREIEQGIETHEDAASGSTSPKARAKKGEAWKKWIKVEKPAEVPDDLWKQFGEIRALKKMALTERALELLRTEGEKAHMTLLQVVETCCGNGWAGFKASWLTKAIGNAYRKPQNITQTAEYRERLQACCRGEGRTEKLADDGVTIIVD